VVCVISLDCQKQVGKSVFRHRRLISRRAQVTISARRRRFTAPARRGRRFTDQFLPDLADIRCYWIAEKQPTDGVAGGWQFCRIRALAGGQVCVGAITT